MAASILFSVILIAGLAVYSAAQGRAALYSVADGEDYLADGFHVLMAAEGVDILLGAQGVVASQPLVCSSAMADVAQGVGALGDLQKEGGLTVASNAVLVQETGVDDNLSALRPYNGSVAGDLDLALRYNGSGSAGAAVTFNRSETHYAHLGVHLASGVADCAVAAAAIGAALNGSTLPGCTPAAAGAVIQEAEQGPGALARSGGFKFAVGYSTSGGASCRVDFLVTLEQTGIQGPGGSFSVQFEEPGSAYAGT